MTNISVYDKMISSNSDCMNVLKEEISMKTSCMPFAIKLIDALKSLNLKSDYDKTNACNVLLSNLQTLSQGGIMPEDYDKIDFIKRGKTITISARVEAFYRACARKGYRITDTIVAVPRQDAATTYFEEHFSCGDIIYTLCDKRICTDRAITAQRLIDKYFAKFIIRLDIFDISASKRVCMVALEMSSDEILQVASVSEQGIYKSNWQVVKDLNGNEKKQKVISDELNTGGFWVRWTGEMVNKTIIRRALKRVKEVLPALSESIYAFENEPYEEEEIKVIEPKFEVTLEVQDVNLSSLTKEQQDEASQMLEIYKANPKMAEDDFLYIINECKSHKNKQDIINSNYAKITALCASRVKREKLEAIFSV